MSEEYDLSRAFERIENYLINSMMRNFKHHRAEETAEGYNWEQWQVKQLESLEEYRRNNREKFSAEFADLNDRVGDMLRATAADASYKQEQKILRAIQKGYAPRRSTAQSHAAFFRLNERKMNALIEATTNDLKRAEQAVLRRSNDAYRKAIFDAHAFMNSGAATYEQAVDMAVKDMLSAGLQCVEYSNGARHTLSDYAEMAIRTANKRAYLRGEGLKMQEWGMSTVIINRRHGACGRCADFVGMVFIDDVYAGGKPSDHGGKYPLLSDAMKAGLFHPRCKDSSSLYIEGISTPPDREVLPKKAQEDLTEIERAEQRAAYGRRMEKMNRRLSKYALDPDNKTEYLNRADQWAKYTEKWEDYHEKQLAKVFVPAKSIEEAEEFIRQFVDDSTFGALGVSYQGVSVDVANELNRTISDFYVVFDAPKFGGILAPAGNTKLGKKITGATAAYSPVRNSFLVNRKSMKDIKTARKSFQAEKDALQSLFEHPEKYDFSKLSKTVRDTIERSRISGRATVATSIEEAIQHELGHMIEKKVYNSPLWETVFENIPRFADRISGYAGTNKSEYIAESFVSYMKGEKLCDPNLIKIFESLKR